MAIYAVLGSTGNCGTALIQNLLKQPDAKINAYCRSRSKLLRLVPEVEDSPQVEVFEGSIQDEDLLMSCLKGSRAVFLVVSTNDNLPGCHLSQDTAVSVMHALESLKQAEAATMPKLVLLSSATIDDHFSQHLPWLLRQILLRSASHVYNDLREAERLLRAQEDWLTTIYIKPGALSVDQQRGHALSFTEEGSPLSYMDLAAAMAEAADDEDGRYDLRNVSVVNTNGRAKFPTGTPLCILTGLLRHFLPFLHPYLPTTGP
ncbi:putative NAD-dependent epimerase/dehydratase [Amylocarpus encephaloides]|uniref:NAD-dependent epimerase/dehydratase n=1 Tax=Amylocarpus encephaloides TaxID=45428 RepID=A0A9P7YB08_9HELO|nr:putative NAD-dependent epimerase/dehydratase [Amylocarpus encephaloides]